MPVQVPVVAVNVCPTVAVPDTTGATVLTGTAAATELVALELADALPALLLAVTTQRTALPTSAPTNVYVLLVAPLILTPARCH